MVLIYTFHLKFFSDLPTWFFLSQIREPINSKKVSPQKEIHPAEEITRRKLLKTEPLAMTLEQRFKRYAGMPSGPVALEGNPVISSNISNPTVGTGLDFKSSHFDPVRGEDFMRGFEI